MQSAPFNEVIASARSSIAQLSALVASLEHFAGLAEQPDLDARELVLCTVAKEYGMTRDMLFCRRKKKFVVRARHMAIWFLTKTADMDHHQIGELFNQSRSNISHACTATHNDLCTDRATQDHAKMILKLLSTRIRAAQELNLPPPI